MESLAASPLFVETFRDWVIIVMGIMVAAYFLVLMLMTLVLSFVTRALLHKVSDLLDERVQPLLDSARETATTVKGTTSYVSNAAVEPIIRTAGVIAGVRRAAGVIAGLTGAGGEKPKE